MTFSFDEWQKFLAAAFVLISTACAMLLASAWLVEGASPAAKVRLGRDLPYEMLQDPLRTLDAATVSQLPSSDFSLQHRALSLGFSDSARWLRLPAPSRPSEQPPGTPWWLVLSPPYLDDIRVYIPTGNGWQEVRTGDRVSAHERPVLDRHFVVPLHAAAGEMILIRLESSSANILEGYFTTPEQFASQRFANTFMWGVYFGLAVITTVLCAGLGFILRSRLSLAACSFAVAYLMVAHTQGFAQSLLFKDYPFLADRMTGTSVMLSMASLLWVFREALDTRMRAPAAQRALAGCGWIIGAGCLSPFLDIYEHVAPAMYALFTIACLGTAILALKVVADSSATHADRWMSLILTIFATKAIYSALTLTDIISMPVLSIYMWQFGMLALMLAVTILSLHQLWTSQKKITQLQSDLLLQMRAEQSRLTALVDARTREIQGTNAALQSSLKETRQAHFRQRQFLGVVAHEFRTPLAVISSAIANLEEFPNANGQTLFNRLTQIGRSVKRLTTLTDNFLADERLAGSPMLNEHSQIQLSEIVATAVKMADLSVTHEIKMWVQPGCDFCSKGDSALLTIAISNVLDNAVKYTPNGCVNVELTRQGETIRIVVRDKGPGIPEYEASTIFEKYQRGSHAASTHGTGMGLYVSREIMRAHGGTLQLLSSSVGAVFEFILPCRPASPREPSHV